MRDILFAASLCSGLVFAGPPLYAAFTEMSNSLYVYDVYTYQLFIRIYNEIRRNIEMVLILTSSNLDWICPVIV